MARLIMWNLMTLDGYFEGSESWSLDWHMLYWGEELEQWSLEQLRSAGMLLFGRITYQGMAAYWSSAEGEVARYMNSLPKAVFSTTLGEGNWANTQLIASDAIGETARLKRQSDKNLFIFGSASLCATLAAHGLIDEYRIGLCPLLLGRGNPLFKSQAERTRLRLIHAQPLSTGCTILRYAPADRP